MKTGILWKTIKKRRREIYGMGDLSLEVYLAHLCILYFLNEYNWWINATWYFKWLIVIIATIVILAVYKMMYKYVYSHLIHKEAQL